MAGASGFIGRALSNELGERFDVVGLTRRPQHAAQETSAGAYRWKRVDLFSRVNTRRALEGASFGVYLVHSLHPSARLTQGHVGDLDIICADNFARAARFHGLEHIVYVRPLASEATVKKSPFLASRAEVAATLAAYDTPVTTLRASLVIGNQGDATQVLFSLVERLKVLLLPCWTHCKSRPIALGDLVDIIGRVVDQPRFSGRAHDVCGADAISFEELLRVVADLTGRKRRFLSIPAGLRGLSARFLSLATGRPVGAMQAMVDALSDDSIVDCALQEALGQEPTSVASTLRSVIGTREGVSHPPRAVEEETSELVVRPRSNEVRAVHRLTPPSGQSAAQVAEEYRRWVPRFFGPIIDVRRVDEQLNFYVRGVGWPLLVLEFDHSASTAKRQLYWIRGGLLARRHDDARLEFREVLGGRRVLAAIHEFYPRLPWALYVTTQAWIHHRTMRAFERHLNRLDDAADEPPRRLDSS